MGDAPERPKFLTGHNRRSIETFSSRNADISRSPSSQAGIPSELNFDAPMPFVETENAQAQHDDGVRLLSGESNSMNLQLGV
jgi:hypothetical protein